MVLLLIVVWLMDYVDLLGDCIHDVADQSVRIPPPGGVPHQHGPRAPEIAAALAASQSV